MHQLTKAEFEEYERLKGLDETVQNRINNLKALLEADYHTTNLNVGELLNYLEGLYK